MYVRVTTLSDATDLEAGLAQLAESAVGELTQMRGYRGLAVSGDRAARRVGVLALWETLEDLQASDSAVSKVRHAAVAAFGGTATVEVFEEIASEVGSTPPGPGCSVIIRRARIDPARIEEAIAFNRDVSIPQTTAQPGFRGMRAMVNRDTGEAIVGIVFDSLSSMNAARAHLEGPVLEQARGLGVEMSEPEIRELLYAHMP